MLNWIKGLFGRGGTPMSDVAQEFGALLPLVKMSIYELSVRDFSSNTRHWDAPTCKALGAMVSNYLTGDEFGLEQSDLSDEVQRVRRAYVDKIAEMADLIVAEDAGIREVVVQTARMRMFVSRHIGGEQYYESPEFARLRPILERYGSDVPDTPTPDAFRKLVVQFSNWNAVQDAFEREHAS